MANTHKLAGSLGAVHRRRPRSRPTYAQREAAEWEAFAPTDTVLTDTYQYETNGELGLASGNKPLVQPTEICTTSQTSCIQTAEEDIVNRGYFLGTGTNTFFTAASTALQPEQERQQLHPAAVHGRDPPGPGPLRTSAPLRVTR